MSRDSLPKPELTIDRAHARRFLLRHQRLLPPRRLEGRDGILEFFGHVGCVQFDPIDIVGRNPDLVLQSRVAGYVPDFLEDLLYRDRELFVGWDKMSAVTRAADWPLFARHRALMVRQHGAPERPEMRIAPLILGEIRARGPLSSRDIEHEDQLDWAWGRKTRLVRASLEVLAAMGLILPHHRVRSVRYFDLAERLLPDELLAAPDPHRDDQSYEDWHVLRRIGSLGLAPASGAPEYWWGILGVKGVAARARVLTRLAERGDVVALAVEGVPTRAFFIRAGDRRTLDETETSASGPPEAALLAPLDNLAWDRELLRGIFGFDYCWEVYKPPEKRQYGYYVLPVLCGDRLIARAEPRYDRKAKVLSIEGWWWEVGVKIESGATQAIAHALKEFARYLGASDVRLSERLRSDRALRAAVGPVLLGASPRGPGPQTRSRDPGASESGNRGPRRADPRGRASRGSPR